MATVEGATLTGPFSLPQWRGGRLLLPVVSIARALGDYVRVRLYTDGIGEPYARQQRLEQERFGTVALPLYAILAPDGRTVATFLGMTRDPQEFVRFLEAGRTASSPRGASSAPPWRRPPRRAAPESSTRRSRSPPDADTGDRASRPSSPRRLPLRP